MAAMNIAKEFLKLLQKTLPKVHDLFSPKQVNSLIQDCKVSVMVEIGLFQGNKERQDENANPTAELLKVYFRDVLSYHVTTTFQNHLFAFPFNPTFTKAYGLK